MIMKKVFNSLFVIIAAMVTFAGCAKQEIEAPTTVETKTVQFYAESIETKTAFGTPDGTTYPTLWTENDKEIKLLLNLTEEAAAKITTSDDFTSATFEADFKGEVDAPYTFCAISPSTVYLGKTTERFSVTIPMTQTPTAKSVDEAAQILYAVSDSYKEFPETVSFNFKHFTAYGKVSFINLNLDGAKVTSVAITSSVPFANRWNCFVTDETFAENTGASTITLETAATENLWFACAPVGEMNGETLTFTINTDKGPLSKTVTLGEKHKFEAGRIAKMKVDMDGIEFSKSKVYELVTDESDLTVDSKIIIVASGYDQALSTTQNSNNRAQAAVTKSSDKSTITDPGNDVQVITIGEGSTDGTLSFCVGEEYLYAPGGGNYLRKTTTLNANASWEVSIAESGVATIKANRSDRNWLRYNSTNNPPIFSCYTSGQADVSIYKLQGTGSTPLPKLSAPTVTAQLNADETGIYVSWDTVNNATTYVVSCTGEEDVEVTGTTYVFEDLSAGDYTIVVTAKADGYRSAKSEAIVVTVPFVGGAGVGAAYTAEFYGKSITLGNALTIDDVNWTITAKGSTAINNGTADQGKQFGTKNSPCTELVFKGTGYNGGIQSIKVNTSCASNTGPKIASVTVGGVAMTAPSSTALQKGTNKEFAFTSTTPLTGEIVITWTSSVKAGIYVKSIIINN